MNLLQRFGFFSVGLIMGIIILMFFLGGKRASCDYSPNDRTLKNIRIKERIFSEEAYSFFKLHDIDTSTVDIIFDEGNVNFSKSKTKAEPCRIYYIEGETESGKIELQVENCEETATIQKVKEIQ